MQRILITGTNGLIGHRLASGFKGFQVFSLSGHNELNISNEELVNSYLAKIKPDLIIHCAALANVETCEREKQKANDINIKGTRNLIKASEKYTKKFIYISTDLVFENQVAPELGFRESDLSSCYSHYANTKLIGESLVFASSIDEVNVLRLSLALDLHPSRGYLTHTLNKLNSGQSLEMYEDEIRTPLFTRDLLKALEIFINKTSKRNIFHIGGREKLSRYELGLKIADVWDINPSLIIKTSIQSHIGIVPRAKNVSLNSTKFWNFVGIEPNPTEIGLAEIKNQLFTS